MKELPILFSSEMVRAILDGRKTQTRRVIKPQPTTEDKYQETPEIITDGTLFYSYLRRNIKPKYKVGDKLYVRETFRDAVISAAKSKRVLCEVIYKSDLGVEACLYKWKPSIHMPKKLARIWLEVTGVRVERLQEISLEDIRAEGLIFTLECDGSIMRTEFKNLWDSINGKKYPWESNPWVWVYEFKRIAK